jgi:hypothetical protein
VKISPADLVGRCETAPAAKRSPDAGKTRQRTLNRRSNRARLARKAAGQEFALIHIETLRLFLAAYGLTEGCNANARRGSPEWQVRNVQIRRAMEAAINERAARVTTDTANSEERLLSVMSRDILRKKLMGRSA